MMLAKFVGPRLTGVSMRLGSQKEILINVHAELRQNPNHPDIAGRDHGYRSAP